MKSGKTYYHLNILFKLVFTALLFLPILAMNSDHHGAENQGGIFAKVESNHSNHDYIWPSDSAVRKKLSEWQDWKFGVLIHWGPYSEWGVVESWSLCPEDEGWCVRRGPYAYDYYEYRKAYEDIRKTFYPEKFNPQHWAQAVREAGMKYMVFTTKHHDGFCMFDSRFTDYKITDPGSRFSNHPKSNVVKEVFTAFRKEGLGIGAYFSKPDWHSPDYWWPYFPVFDRNVNYDPGKYPDRWESFKKFTHNQIRELMEDYGKIDILWLDGGWVRPENTLTDETQPWLGKNQWIQDIDMPSVAAMARQHQPGVLIVDRTVHGEYENYRTPEQQIPDAVPDYPWESCITLGDNWYSTGPGEKYKSSRWVIHTLIKIVSKGGNFLLGIGPDKSGEMVPEVYARLEEVGNWMQINGESIYNSQPLTPYQSDHFCFTQSKNQKTKYLFYLVDESETLPEKIIFPDHFIGNSPSVHILGLPESLQFGDEGGRKVIFLPDNMIKQQPSPPAIVFRVRQAI